MATPGKASPPRTGWIGWIYFGGLVLLATGVVHVVNGVIALARADVVPAGTLLPVDLTGLGWGLLIGGIVLGAVGAGLLTGRSWARVLGIVLATLSILGTVGVFAAFPVWSTVVIVLDVIVLYALSAHWNEIGHHRAER